MKTFKSILFRIFNPGWYITLPLTLISIVLGVLMFALDWPSIFIYVMSPILAYSLTIFIIWFVNHMRKTIIPFVKSLMMSNRYTKHLVESKESYDVSKIYISLFMNLLFVMINMTSGIINFSPWKISIAFYYLVLAIMLFILQRGVVIDDLGKDLRKEYGRYRICAYNLFGLNVVFIAMVSQIFTEGTSFRYEGLLIYVMAFYAFYKTISAIVNVFKYRNSKSPVISAAKVIQMASAFLSMFALESAMLTAFGNDEYFEGMALGITGFVISILFVVTSIVMIVKSHIMISKLKKEADTVRSSPIEENSQVAEEKETSDKID